MNKILLSVFFVLCYHAGFCQWTQVIPVNAPARSRETTFVIGDTAYLGNGDEGFYANTFSGYTIGGSTWSPVRPFPGGGGDNGYSFVIGDTAYVGGGASPGYNSALYAYNPQTGWIAKNGVAGGTARAFASAFSIGNKGYVGLGEIPYQTVTGDFYEYDPVLDVFTPIATFPGGAREACAGFSANGKGYVGLGATRNPPTFNDMYRYDPTINKWDTMAPLPATFGMEQPAYFVLCGKLIVTLGDTLHTATNSSAQTWMFDPSDGPIGKWSRLPDFPGTVAYAAQGFTIQDTGYVLGGYLNGTYLSQMWQYTPTLIPPSTVTICAGSGTPLIANGGSVYKWSPSVTLSDSITSSPSVTGGVSQTTASPSITTTYTITEAVCGQTATVVVTVSSAGSLSIIPKSPTICAGQSVTLSVPGNVTNVVWSPATGLNKTTGDTVTATLTTGVVYTVTASGGCALSGTDTVSVSSADTLNFTPAIPKVCPGQSITISVSDGSNFNWSPSTGLNQTSGDTVIASLPPSVDSIVYRVTGSGLSGCPDTGFVTLRTGGGSISGIIITPRDTICQGTPGNLSLSGNSSNTVQWQSSLNDTNFTNLAGDTLTKYKTNPLSQTTWYRVIAGTGNCSSVSDTQQLYVPPALIASFNFVQTAANQLTFNSDSSSGNIRSYHWDFGDGQTSEDKSPQHMYAKDTTYYVCLTLYDGSNCSYTFCRYSEVTDAVPYIPAQGQWVIYPDPFANSFFINGKELNRTIERIEIYDVLGRVTYSRNYKSQNNIIVVDLLGLSQGMYILNIKTADADFFQPVIKQH